jgi:two-component system, NtrC family, C4-dicarboxylate transport sensor histidine kinase DctB
MNGPEQALARLARGVDFEPVRDVDFDTVEGRLDVVRSDGSRQTIHVPRAFWPTFAAADGQEEVTIDFASVDGQGEQPLRLVVDGVRGACAWEGGMLIRPGAAAPSGGDRGVMSAMAVHELKQPLFTIGMAARSIGLMLEQAGGAIGDDRSEGIGQAAARIRLQVERAHAIMSGIIGYVQPAMARAADGDVARALLEAADFLQPLFEQHGVVVTLDIREEALPVPLPHVALEQVIVNAIQNAVDSLELARRGGRQAMQVEMRAEVCGDHICCQIRDDGEGLGRDAGEEVFRPFFTTKSGQGNLGLGLHISRQIVSNAGGIISLTGNERHGATLSFTLPRIRS